MKKQLIGLGLIASIVGYGTCTHALTIAYDDISGGAINTEQMAAFNAAAAFWESSMIDDVTVRIDIDMQALGDKIIGGTESVAAVASYADIRDALYGDSTSTSDATAVTNLQTTSSLNVVVNKLFTAGDGWIVDSNDTVGMNTYLAVNRANLKALGLLSDDGNSTDASITMSSDFDFDFNRNDGIDSDKMDFTGVMVHEIGHALGFVSGVDAIDFWSGLGPGVDSPDYGSVIYDWGWSGDGTDNTLDTFAIFSVLDLFRYSDLVTSGAGAGYLDWAYESGVAGLGQSYFSIDGGFTDLANFSTGYYNGDGRQASHWKDNLNLGRLDPTIGYGENFELLSPLDLQAFDVIGWDITTPVPEPMTILLFGTGLGGLIATRIRKKKKK